MSFLSDLLSAAYENPTKKNQYDFDNDTFNALNALTYVMNPSVTTNANFSTLGAHGLTPVTQADGDDAEWSSGWKVVGAGVATYTLTSTPYPTGLIGNNSPSLVQSFSPYYEKVVISGFTTGDLYFYQRQANSVRAYQKNFLTYGLFIRNNQSTAKKVRAEIYSYYDTANKLQVNNTIYLQPGINRITSQINTESLRGITIGGGNYTEFRLRFLDLVDGTADLDIYQIKCEFGKISTLLAPR